MKTIEFRIPMPATVDEYLVGQNWAVNEQSRLETGGGEGVEIVKNEPFTNQPHGPGGKFDKGQYTYKVYKVASKVPKYIRTLFYPILGNDGYNFHEEAWNAYPYCKTVITNPGFMKEGLRIVLESMHLQDTGDSSNALQKDEKELAQITSEVLDIAGPKSPMLAKDMTDPATLTAKLVSGAVRGPLSEGWLHQSQWPVMTCYKQVSVHCKWGLLTNKLETVIINKYREILLAFHQKIWLWIEQWSHLSLEDVRALEKKTKEELEQRIKDAEKRGDSLG